MFVMKRAVIIMAKVPRAGNVKTRLQPFLSAQQSADLAACFLEDAIGKVKSMCNQIIIAFAPAAERAYFDRFALSETIFHQQTGSDLGARMSNAFEFAFSQNADSVLMIGTDSPTFPAEFIERAFADLETADAVLGKTADGGFYLIGLTRLKKEIFENVEWSSAQTLRQTEDNIKRGGLSLKKLPEWFDVDEAADLERLRRDFARNENLSLTAPRTFDWLRANL